MFTRTSNDGMGTVEVTDDELRAMAALDVSEGVEVLRGTARVRIDMSNRHAPLSAARDLLALAPAMAAELRAARAEVERLRERGATLDAAATALDCAPREVATVAARLRERATDLARRTADDERADVVAWLAGRWARSRARTSEYEAFDTGYSSAYRAATDDIARGAHVGAAKGGE